jgi:serine/threonine-protein kinase
VSAPQPTPAEVHALFERVIDLAPAARSAILDEVCAGRPDLRARIEALIDIDTAGDMLLDAEPSQVWAALLEDDEPEGRLVGPWRIVREIGRGGMGAVYLAERADGDFEQRVALKVVKRGMDTDEILERFRHERRILASLEHPSIARLYDGGASEDGLPYLVMELVDGEPITSWCDRQRLTIDERIDLFGTVCAAVQHAHQKLVVHRDIKPSNILVATDGTPRLLDFGIARLLDANDAAAPVTRTGMRILTPAYAAPEQIRGEPPTAATDVFALGAVLYELLTGDRPFEDERGGMVDPDRAAGKPSARTGSGPGADNAAARSTSPERLRRRLAGDLDTIVLKALEPDPALRYGSALQLLDDLERHRAGHPIRARPPTFAYRARKFVRRNRSGVAAAALVLLTLLGGLGSTLWQAQRAARERDISELARANAEQVTAFLLDMFDSADPLDVRMERADTLRVRAIVDRGAERVRRELAGQPDLLAEMLTVFGKVYANLGIYDTAESMLEDALQLAVGRDAPLRHRISPLTLLATAAHNQGDFPRADSLLARALAIYEETATQPDSFYVWSASERGVTLMYLAEYDESRRMHERALALIDSLGIRGNPLHGRAVNNLGLLHSNLAQYDSAAASYEAALEIERRYLPVGHPRLASILNNLATSTHYDGRLAEAEPIYIEAVTTARAALGDEHSEVGAYLQNLATLYDDQGRYAEADTVYRQSIDAHEASIGRTSVNTALLLRNYALNRLEVNELDHAQSLLREALATIRSGLGGNHLYTAVTHVALGRVLVAAGRLEEALGHLETGASLLDGQLAADHYLRLGAKCDLGAWYTARGEYDAAEPLLLEAHEGLVAQYAGDHHTTRRARRLLHELYVAWDRPDRAAQFVAT